MNSAIEIEANDQPFSIDIGEALVKAHDLIIDCTDNFATRYLINDLCVQWGKPWVFASVYQFSGQCALFVPGGACFRCLFAEMPSDVPDCNAGGVLGVLPGLVGAFQANEAIKYLAGLITPLSNCLLLIEALDLEFRRIQLQSDPQCATCGSPRTGEHLSRADHSSNDNEVSAGMDILWQISSAQFDRERDSQANLILDVRSKDERKAFHIGGDHVTLEELPEALLHFSHDTTIICYCQSGVRSLEAVQQLRSAGFTAHSLTGGLAQWLHHKQKTGGFND
ncbi:MAG: hypothetical protein DRR06_11060 [Gammaproteobacteria bacterium]|nr:MAG: hypothetical protein DRR06_11060 [Gammaproteobacteria bacterium]